MQYAPVILAVIALVLAIGGILKPTQPFVAVSALLLAVAVLLMAA